MKIAKEDDKSLRPMFPRVHVSETEKGGPRAPPRNKMALYEQISVTSQKYNSLILSPISPGSLSSPTASIQGVTHERAAFYPTHSPNSSLTHERAAYNLTHPPNSSLTHSAAKNYAQPSDGKGISTKGMNSDRSTGQMNSKTTFSTGMTYLESKRDDDNDDFRVPIVTQLRVSPQSNDVPSVEVSNSASFDKINAQNSSTLDSFVYVEGSLGMPIHEYIASEKLATKRKKAYTEKETKESTLMLSDPLKSLSVPSTRPKLLDKREPQILGKRTESSQNCSVELQHLENSNAFKMKNSSCFGAAFEFSPKISYGRVNNAEEFQDTEKSDEGSEMSLIVSVSELDISPDDVVGVIGPKQFWKARRAIVNQQRVFAVQVFELHRLIKVQKQFAASPHLLLDDCHLIAIQPKSLLLASSLKQQQRNSSEHTNNNLNADSTAKERPPSPLQVQAQINPNKVLDDLYRNAPPTASTLEIPMAPNGQPNTWCFCPPTNQWLIPVMSPSEGLIFKPYSGPCPPVTGFMQPLYGGCGPLTVPYVSDFMNSASGSDKHIHKFPAAQSSSSIYFPSPYGMPIMHPNSLFPAAAKEQITPLNKGRQTEQAMLHSRSSPRSISYHPTKNNTSKDRSTQTCTASSLSNRVHELSDGVPLPLFAPTASGGSYRYSQSGGKNNHAQAIKAVPHNGRSATESAARIFRSIQRERQQHDY